MCLTVPGLVTQVQGPMAEVQSGEQHEWFNALAQPDVKVGDYVLTHANLIVAIISEEEAMRMQDALDEVERKLQEEEDAATTGGGSDPSDGEA